MRPTEKATALSTFWLCERLNRHAQVPNPTDCFYPEVTYRHLLAVLDELGIDRLQ